MKTVIIQEQLLRDLRVAKTDDVSKFDTTTLSKGVEDSVNTLLDSNKNEASLISCFNSIKDPRVLGEIDIYDFLECVRRPEQETKSLIEKAREYKSNKRTDLYYKIKAKLPCFTLNFSFVDRKNNKTIKAPTGLIYIDIDNELDVDLSNNLVFASWKSLSGLGRGVLVKVEGLTLDNFKTTYFDVTRSISINADKHAAKATQYTIHSYDEDIYINHDALTWTAKEEINNTPITYTYKKKKEKDVYVVGENQELVYNNIADFDFGNKDYLFFPDEKAPYAEAFIPLVITVGARNQILSSFATQMRALNPRYPPDEFVKFIINVNRSRCVEPLKDEEVLSMVNKILKLEYIEPIYNKPRRVIFNPDSKLNRKEKMAITNKLTGRLTIAKTKTEIKECLDKWDVKIHGKVTQKQLALVIGKNIKTIEKYYFLFKEQKQKINARYRMPT